HRYPIYGAWIRARRSSRFWSIRGCRLSLLAFGVLGQRGIHLTSSSASGDSLASVGQFLIDELFEAIKGLRSTEWTAINKKRRCSPGTKTRCLLLVGFDRLIVLVGIQGRFYSLSVKTKLLGVLL